MAVKSMPYFDATFPSFVRKAQVEKAGPKPAKCRVKQATAPADLKQEGKAFFRRSLLLGR